MASQGNTGFKAESEAIPEAPIPRSILIRPPTAGESQQERPAFSFGPPPLLKRSAGSKPQSQPAKLTTAEQRWDVVDGSLECISPQFPVERSHVLIRNSSPSIIANRIAQCLASVSAATTYNSKEASAVVETQEGVKLKITLFKVSDQPDGVLLECQRRRGDSYNFHKISRDVLRAGRGEEPNKERCQPSFTIPSSIISGEGRRLRPSDPLP